jgi:hypothetical protein
MAQLAYAQAYARYLVAGSWRFPATGFIEFPVVAANARGRREPILESIAGRHYIWPFLLKRWELTWRN